MVYEVENQLLKLNKFKLGTNKNWTKLYLNGYK